MQCPADVECVYIYHSSMQACKRIPFERLYRAILCRSHSLEFVSNIPHVFYCRHQKYLCGITWLNNLAVGIFWQFHVPFQPYSVCDISIPTKLPV